MVLLGCSAFVQRFLKLVVNGKQISNFLSEKGCLMSTSAENRTLDVAVATLAGVAPARRGRNQRLVSRCRVEVDHASGTGEGETEDISPSGLYVRTEALLPVGEEADLRLTLPDGSVVALYARVAHCLGPTAARALGRHTGMGLELIGPD